MLIDFEIDPDDHNEIMRFVKMKKYEDDGQFVQRAIKNLLTRENSLLSQPGISQTQSSEYLPTRGISVEDVVDADSHAKFIEVKSLAKNLPKYLTKLSPEKSEEFNARPLIWNFYTRMFPVKLVVIELAAAMMHSTTNWMTLEALQDGAYALALGFAKELREYESENKLPRHKRISTGLPATELIKHGKRGRAITKASAKIESSRKRFAEQFIGTWINKRDPKIGGKIRELKPGACFEMGLIGYESDESSGETYLTLTKEGNEFARLVNPIIGGSISETIFSEEEVHFIQNKIFPRFKLENKIIGIILHKLKTKKDLSSLEIDEIFEDEKEKFKAEHPNEAEKSNILIFKDLVSSKICSKCGKEKIVVDKKANKITCKQCGFSKKSPNVADRVATMGRLSELGLVTWNVDNDGRSVYNLNESVA